MWVDMILGLGDTVMNKTDKNHIPPEAYILVKVCQKLSKIYTKFCSLIERDKCHEEK